MIFALPTNLGLSKQRPTSVLTPHVENLFQTWALKFESHSTRHQCDQTLKNKVAQNYFKFAQKVAKSVYAWN